AAAVQAAGGGGRPGAHAAPPRAAWPSCARLAGLRRENARVGTRERGRDALLEKAPERAELGVVRAGLAHVVEHARQIAEVARLAVAVPEAAEDAEHLDVPLHADEI